MWIFVLLWFWLNSAASREAPGITGTRLGRHKENEIFVPWRSFDSCWFG